jgi:hypothetical protein
MPAKPAKKKARSKAKPKPKPAAKKSPPPASKPNRKQSTAPPPRPRSAPSPAAYERHKDRTAERQRQQSRESNDILPFPEVLDPRLVEKCRTDFERFCRELMALWFPLPFSDDHRKFISKGETSAIDGGLVGWAMPRGSGKSALCKALAIWAEAYRWRRYIVLIGPDAGHSNRMLRDIKGALRFNDQLLGAFPQICHPIRKLQGKAIKAANQHAGGEETRIVWSEGKLVLPTVRGSTASGGIMTNTGITGQIRGLSEMSSDGTLLRPDLVIVDDFQTRESAFSASQCESREATILGDIMELSGPGVEMCGIIPCTIIRHGDAASRLLDRSIHPEFRGERMKALYALPKNMEWWDNYAELYKKALREEDTTGKVNAKYTAERQFADEGAIVAWPERKKPGDVSALQSLMHVRILKPDVFDAEYQNEPKDFSLDSLNELSPAMLGKKLNGLHRGTVPITATKITIGTDVQKRILYYCVVAWDSDFTGSIIDYGTWPDQRRRYFLTHQINQTLAKQHPDRADLEGQVFAGLDALTRKLLGVEWPRDGKNGIVRVCKNLIDGNWPEAMNVIYQFCRQSNNAAMLLPSRGAYIGAKSKRGITEHALRPGERPGLEWTIPATTRREIPHVRWDTNWWKSFVLSRLTVPIGSRGCLSVFGSDEDEHRMLFDHLCSERRREIKGPEKTVMEWDEDKSKENHWWDCLVMATVAASIEGIGLKEVHEPVRGKPKRKRVSFAAEREKARARQ